MAMLPPFILWVTDNPYSDSSSLSDTCNGTPFTIFAQYGTHQWLINKFEKFKAEHQNAFDFEVCYEIRIEDSKLDTETKPVVWIPESFVWLDIADDDYDTTFVENRTRDCVSTTDVPFGIVTWSKFAELISPDNTPVPLQQILDLAKVGWKGFPFQNGSIEDHYDGIQYPCAYIEYIHANM